MLDDTLVVAIGEFGRSPEKGVSTSSNSMARMVEITGLIATLASSVGPVSSAAMCMASRTKPARPTEDPVHPTEILATVYHAMGIDPQTIVHNHLNQPRELVKAEAVERLFA